MMLGKIIHYTLYTIPPTLTEAQARGIVEIDGNYTQFHFSIFLAGNEV